jgi:hypothetical protein
MSLKDDILRFTLMKTLTDLVKGEADEARAELFPDLLEQFNELGTKSFTVKVPGAEKVATFTIAEPKPATKVDDAALIRWCELNRPDLLTDVEHPPVEAWTQTVLTDGALKEIMATCPLVGEKFYTETGEEVEGVTYIPAGTPKSFTVRYEKGGQERVIQAWRDGDLAGIEPGKNLPQIGSN